MYCVEEMIETGYSARPAFVFLEKLEQNWQRVEKLKNSIRLYYKNIHSGCEYHDLSDNIKIFNEFMESVAKGGLQNLVASVESEDLGELSAWIKKFKQAQAAADAFIRTESEVTRRCVKCWEGGLTDVNVLRYHADGLSGYSFILQAVDSFDPLWCFRGPAVSASLYTDKLPYTYRNRKGGIIYKLTQDNFVTMSISDASSHMVHMTTDDERIKATLELSCIAEYYNLCFNDGPDSCYYPYKVFVDKCLERARTIKEDSDKYNEILLKPWFENDILAIFYRYDAAGWFKKQAEGLASIANLPLVIQEENGMLRNGKKTG
ncbi:MAG: hypothetical protein HFH67_17920 [Lachnospiraceae bacterium]|nr:hypothetical protein [Lachnospiraceae bacterium]